ncbi:MAG: citramalate synthase, partial [Pseudomonadota bacterium]
MNQRERIYLFDTTLRDGNQTPGIDFSVEDKITIAKMLDEFGLDYVEGGYPGANPTDTAFFKQKRTQAAQFVAFGMTKRAGVSASNDPGLNGLLNSQSDAICFVAKAWDFQVEVALGCTLDQNLDCIAESVKATAAKGKTPMVDCEHFFDGWKANRDYAIACATTAHGAGARWVILCDTNGGTQPHEIAIAVRDLIDAGIPGDRLGIHAHNDTEQAVAYPVQGSLNMAHARVDCG